MGLILSRVAVSACVSQPEVSFNVGVKSRDPGTVPVTLQRAYESTFGRR